MQNKASPVFGRLPKENFDSEYLRLIKDDIAQAQAHLEELPESQRRGLTLDTYRHFSCGYLPNWILTKSRAEYTCGLYTDKNGKAKHLPPPSPRIIIPTPSLNHFNAVATPAARANMNKEFWKQHAGSKSELFGDPDALDADLIVIVEGEADAMSIWQCSVGKIAVAAIMGCANWKKTLLPKLPDLRGKKILLLFDADDGKDKAKELCTELLKRGYLAVMKFIYDALPTDDQNFFGIKADANRILEVRGDEYLNSLLEKIIADATPDFNDVAAQIRQQNLFVQEKSPLSVTEKSFDAAPLENVDRDEIKLILKDFVHAKDLDRDDWVKVGMILYRYGFTLEDWQEWSKDDSRYSSETCATQWKSFKTSEELKGKGYTVATLIQIAKQFGYRPPRKAVTFDTDGEEHMTQDFIKDCSVNLRLPDKTNFYLEEKKVAVFSFFDEQIAKWQAVNGVIDPSLLPKIKDAVAFVNDLSPFNFSASLAFDVAARNNVALLKFYLPAFADKFFDILKNARDISKAALHLIKKESGGHDVSGFSQLKKLAALAPSKIHAEIDSLAADIKKQHKSFLRDYHAKIAGEKVKARLDEEKKQRESETTATNAKGCPITLRIPYDCYFNDRGISLIDFSGKFPKTIAATKNPIVPTKILREPNNHSVQYEVAVKAGNVWRNVIVDGRVLFDPRQILVLADKGAWIEDPKSLAKFFARIIAENDSVIPEIKFYSQPGWKGTDFKFFAYPSGSDDYFVRRAGFDYQELFAKRGDSNLWLKKFQEVTEVGDVIVKVFLGNALLAPLIRPLNLQNAQIHIEAPNNSGKSALLKFAASIYGNPLELLKTFAASPKNRIAVAAASNDLPSFFDELETLGGKQAESTLSSMIYEFAEGVANQANKRDGTAREPVKFKGTRLSTAERAILKSHDQRGAYKRLVQLKVFLLFPDDFGSELHFFAENNFGHFGKHWTDYITQRLQDILRAFAAAIKAFPNSGFSDSNGNFRPVEPTHLKSVVASLLSFYLFEISCNLKPKFNTNAFLADVIEILSLLPTPAELDDSTRALADLQSFVAAHDKFFERDVKDNSADGFTEYRQTAWECFGKKFDNGEVAFFPTALKKILEKDLGYASADALISAFAFKNLLRCTKGRGYRFSTWVNGKSIPMVRFKAGVLLGDDLEHNIDEESAKD